MRTISSATLSFLRNAISDSCVLRRASCSTRHIQRFRSSQKSSVTSNSSRLFASQAQTAPRVHRRNISNQPPPSLEAIFENVPKTHYGFFPTAIPSGPPPSGPFKIDLSALKRDFLRLQAQAHPDRHPPERRSAAQGLSAQINEAYKTLQSPLRRAEYLLELRGARNQADDEHVLGKAEGDEEILLEVMEAREEAEEAEGEEEITRLREQNQKRIDDQIGKLEEAFSNDDLLRAKREAVRLSYWIGVEDRLREGNSMH